MAKPLPTQRWLISPADRGGAEALAEQLGVSPLMGQLLLNRGIGANGSEFLYPDLDRLPDALVAFRQVSPAVPLAMRDLIGGSLDYSIDRLQRAIRNQEKIAICGDYDVDGMTSTALLLRTFRILGGIADYEIPSRMTEGYGINDRIVQDMHQAGVSIIITVDNGISAHQPIALARQLGMTVIVTDHHDIPETLPPAQALLNPKFLAPQSPFATIAGVGVAYVLALELATVLGKRELLENSLLELFTLGTIADLAELSGINRVLVKKGLKLLPHSEIVGIQALIDKAGLNLQDKMRPEAIGFRLGPRINAVGRIGDPQIVIDLLTTSDWLEAQAKAEECEQLNITRQELCAQIEVEASNFIQAKIDQGDWDLTKDKTIVVVDQEVSPDTHWHHGVIGIVASRLVEKFGAPVFIGSVETEKQEVRFSVRSIPEFHVFESLEFISDIRGKGGGHKAAGGFSMPLANLPLLRERLTTFADRSGIVAEHIKPLLQIDSIIRLGDLSLTNLAEMELLQPCGIGNPDPLFCARAVKVLDQRIFGKENNHLKIVLDRGDGRKMNAIAWRWSEYYPVADQVDIVFSAKTKEFREEIEIELELKGLRNFSLTYRQPPLLSDYPQWYDITELRQRVSSLLIYGYDRPENRFTELADQVIYDRPKGECQTIVFWTLPPSLDHLQWILKVARPEKVYLCQNCPPPIDVDQLRQKIKDHLPNWDLLSVSQQWWVSPKAIVAGLRELGYACDRFGATKTLEQELQDLERWYKLSITELQKR